jgi:hypothetical protein
VEPTASGPALEAYVQALIPEIETYVAGGMKAFDSPGLALGMFHRMWSGRMIAGPSQ